MKAKDYVEEAIAYMRDNFCSQTEAANFIINKYKIDKSHNAVRKGISTQIVKDKHAGLYKECDNVQAPGENVGHYWVKTKDYSIFVKNDKGESDTYQTLREDFINELKQFAPIYPTLKRLEHKNPHLLVIDPADIHFGKYSSISETGEQTNNITTLSRFNEGIDGIIQRVKDYNFERIIYVGGNDILHTDNAIGTTTSGTRQDTEGLWHENYLIAKKATVEAIDKLLTLADVHFVFCPSNHDFLTGFFLADAISSHYHNNKNITFDITPIHRKYLHYGASVIGLTHADGAKEVDLSDCIKTEAKAAWGLSKYAYWYVHHIHHKDKKAYKGKRAVKVEKDFRATTVINTGLALTAEDYCYVEYVRSLSGTDRWHFTNGYVHAPKAIEAFIHCPMYGQVARFSHLF